MAFTFSACEADEALLYSFRWRKATCCTSTQSARGGGKPRSLAQQQRIRRRLGGPPQRVREKVTPFLNEKASEAPELY